MLTLEPLPDRLTPSDIPSPADEIFGPKTDWVAVVGAVVPLPLAVPGESVATCRVPATVPAPIPLDPLPVHPIP